MDIQELESTADLPLIRTVMEELRAGLRRLYGDKAPLVLLYGSYARGNANPSSDIDVLLIYQQKVQPGREIRRVGTLLADLNLRYQVLISVLPADQTQYNSHPGVFWQNVRRESKPIEAI